jgi:hypothetical protein
LVALVIVWGWFAELEGFATVMEGVRNTAAIAGPRDYEQIPGLVDRSALRVKNFLADQSEPLNAQGHAREHEKLRRSAGRTSFRDGWVGAVEQAVAAARRRRLLVACDKRSATAT